MPDENPGRLAAKANELYWTTSRPAGRLADELGISRSKFYALIEPLPLDAKCQTCGTPLGFASRSDREAGRARCPRCGAVTQVPAELIPEPPPTTPEPAAEPPPPAPEPTAALPSSRELWLSTLAGVALGMLITAFWRRR